MNWWQILLFPFAIIYDLVTRIRNLLYDSGLFKIHHFRKVKVISVGNLSVGGTGKTPMVEYLIRWALKGNKNVVTLSRGYGRKTKGLVLASSQSTSSDLGDESMGYYRQFGEEIKVVVCENRALGLDFVENEFPETDLVILDDAFQHRRVHRDFNLLLTTYSKPFWKDFVIPSGRLRERRKGWKRADFLIITKSLKDIKISVPDHVDLPHAFTEVKYGQPVMISGEIKDEVVAVSGLADNQPFFKHLIENYHVSNRLPYPDHHEFEEHDIQNLIQESNGKTLLCTSKDAVKLQEWPQMQEVNWGFVPIEVSFLDGEDDFLKKLEEVID